MKYGEIFYINRKVILEDVHDFVDCYERRRCEIMF